MDTLKNKIPELVAILVFFASLTFYSLAVFNINFRTTGLLDLDPRPDSVEYFAGAMSIYRSGHYEIRIGDKGYPSRYPMGYSLAMLPFIYALKEKAIIAPFLVNQLLGLTLMIAFFFYYYLKRRPLAAAVSVGLLATMPAFILFARSSMSELLGASLILITYYFYAKGLTEQKVYFFYIGAIALGLSTVTRIQLVFYCPILFSVFLLKDFGFNKRLYIFILSGFFLCTAASPMLLDNWKTFGNPFSTGYHFWLSKPNVIPVFAPNYIVLQLASIWREFSLTVTQHRDANIFGAGAYFTPAFFILSLWAGLWYFLTMPTRYRFLFLPVAFYTLSVLFYLFAAPRFYFSIALLAIPVIAMIAEAIYNNNRKKKFTLTSAVFIFLLLCQLVGFPSKNGSHQQFTFSHTKALLNKKYLKTVSKDFEIVSLFKEHYGKVESLVISPISPVYLSSLLESNSICIPQDGQHDYQFSKDFYFDKQNTLDYITQSAEKQKRVFYISADTIAVEKLESMLPPLAGFRWKSFYSGEMGSIYEMVSNSVI
jgi:hypothetical protein